MGWDTARHANRQTIDRSEPNKSESDTEEVDDDYEEETPEDTGDRIHDTSEWDSRYESIRTSPEGA